MRQIINEMYKIFIEQDYENGYFDVIFDVQGKELFAHRAILSLASPVFKQMLLKNRSTPNTLIQIDGYSYDEFSEFLRLIYSPYDDDDLNDEDYIYAVIELSNIYEIDEIKENCANVLENILPYFSVKDAFKLFEAAYKYLFAMRVIHVYINENFNDLIEYDDFINLGKSAIQAFVYYGKDIEKSEELCEAVIKWGEYQAMITEEMSEEEKNDLILHYINDILPFFSLKNLLEFFVNQNGLISVNDAKKVKTIQVTVTCKDKSITGSFIDVYGIFDIIKYHKNEILYDVGNKERIFWGKTFDIPSTKSSIQKRENIQWYLLFDRHGSLLYIKHQSVINETDYLIAEMKASNENEIEIGEDGEFLSHEYVYATVSRKYEQIF